MLLLNVIKKWVTQHDSLSCLKLIGGYVKQVKYILIYAEVKAIRLQCGFDTGCVFNITEGFDSVKIVRW